MDITLSERCQAQKTPYSMIPCVSGSRIEKPLSIDGNYYILAFGWGYFLGGNTKASSSVIKMFSILIEVVVTPGVHLYKFIYLYIYDLVPHHISYTQLKYLNYK